MTNYEQRKEETPVQVLNSLLERCSSISTSDALRLAYALGKFDGQMEMAKALEASR